jgi:hypothetical protein
MNSDDICSLQNKDGGGGQSVSYYEICQWSHLAYVQKTCFQDETSCIQLGGSMKDGNCDLPLRKNIKSIFKTQI